MHAPRSTFWKRIHLNHINKLLLTFQLGSEPPPHYNLPQSNPAAPADLFTTKIFERPQQPLEIPTESCAKSAVATTSNRKTCRFRCLTSRKDWRISRNPRHREPDRDRAQPRMPGARDPAASDRSRPPSRTSAITIGPRNSLLPENCGDEDGTDEAEEPRIC
jgi:hypothetical protein